MQLSIIISKSQLQLISHILSSHNIQTLTDKDREEAQILAEMLIEISEDPQAEEIEHDLAGY